MNEDKFGICPKCGADGKRIDTPMMHNSPSGKVMPGHSPTEIEKQQAKVIEDVKVHLSRKLGNYIIFLKARHIGKMNGVQGYPKSSI